MKSKTNGRATTKNEKILLYVLGLLSIFALCYILIIYPAETKTKSVKTEIKSLEGQLVSVKSIDYDISQRQKELDELLVQYAAATVTLPKGDDSDKLMAGVLGIMDKIGIPKTAVNTKGIHEEPVTVVLGAEGQDTANLTGLRKTTFEYNIGVDITKLLSFIDSIEKYERIAEIEEFTWKEIKEEGKQDTGTIKFSFYDTGSK